MFATADFWGDLQLVALILFFLVMFGKMPKDKGPKLLAMAVLIFVMFFFLWKYPLILLAVFVLMFGGPFIGDVAAYFGKGAGMAP